MNQNVGILSKEEQTEEVLKPEKCYDDLDPRKAVITPGGMLRRQVGELKDAILSIFKKEDADIDTSDRSDPKLLMFAPLKNSKKLTEENLTGSE